MLMLCEVKWSEGPYVLTEAYAKTLREKRERFRLHTGTRKAVMVALVTPFGLAPGPHGVGLVDREVALAKWMGV